VNLIYKLGAQVKPEDGTLQ